MNEQELISSINQRLPDNQNRRIKAKDTRDVIGDFLTYSKETFSTKEELAEYGSSAIVGIYDGSKLPTDYALFDVNKVNRFIVKTEGIAPFTSPAEWGSLSVSDDDIENNEVFFIFETNDTWVKYVKRVKGIDGLDGANGTSEIPFYNPADAPFVSQALVRIGTIVWGVKEGVASTSEEPGESAADWEKVQPFEVDSLKSLYGTTDFDLSPYIDGSGKYLNTSYNETISAGYTWGTIPTEALYLVESITVKKLATLPNDLLILAFNNGTLTQLLSGNSFTEVTINIDQASLNYLFSFNPDLLGFTYNVRAEAVDVKQMITQVSDETKGVKNELIIKTGGESIIYPEDFGAEVLDPTNPDAGKDCTAAFNALFARIEQSPASSWRIVFGGIYRIGGAPTYHGDSQLNVNFHPTSQFKFKTIVFEGKSLPSYTDRGNNTVMNPVLGAGFYSSYVHTGTDKKSILAFAAGDNFGLNVTHLYFDKISFYTKGVDGANVGIVNNMSALDTSNLSSMGFSELFIANSGVGMNMPEPNINSMGIYLPQKQNMASIYGNSLKVMGFGVGCVLTEHLNLNHLVVAFCKQGAHIEQTYPINIGNATLEMNQTHLIMDENSCANFGVLQTEDSDNPAHWFYQTGNMIKGPANSRLTVNQTMSHRWGGLKVPLTFDSDIKFRYLMDEYGNSKLT